MIYIYIIYVNAQVCTSYIHNYIITRPDNSRYVIIISWLMYRKIHLRNTRNLVFLVVLVVNVLSSFNDQKRAVGDS